MCGHAPQFCDKFITSSSLPVELSISLQRTRAKSHFCAVLQVIILCSSHKIHFYHLFFFFDERLKLTYLGRAEFRTERTAALRADPLNQQCSD